MESHKIKETLEVIEQMKKSHFPSRHLTSHDPALLVKMAAENYNDSQVVLKIANKKLEK